MKDVIWTFIKEYIAFGTLGVSIIIALYLFIKIPSILKKLGKIHTEIKWARNDIASGPNIQLKKLKSYNDRLKDVYEKRGMKWEE